MKKEELRKLIDNPNNNLELLPDILKFQVVYDLVAHANSKRVDYVMKELFKKSIQEFLANNELFFEGGWALSSYIQVCSLKNFKDLTAKVKHLTKKSNNSAANLLSIFTQFYIDKAGIISEAEYMDLRQDFVEFLKSYKKSQRVFNPLQLNMALKSIGEMNFNLNNHKQFNQQLEILKIIINEQKDLNINNRLITEGEISNSVKTRVSHLINKKTLKEQQFYLNCFNDNFAPDSPVEKIQDYRTEKIVNSIDIIKTKYTVEEKRIYVRDIIIQLSALDFKISSMNYEKQQDLIKIIKENAHYIREIPQIYKSSNCGFKAFVSLLYITSDTLSLNKKYAKEIAALKLNIAKKEDFNKFFILVLQEDYFKQNSSIQYYNYVREGVQKQKEKIEKQIMEKNIKNPTVNSKIIKI